MAYKLFQKNFALSTSTSALSLGLGASEVLVVSSATVCNGDTSSRTVSINLATDGGAASLANQVEYKKALIVNQAANTSLAGKNITPGSALYAYIDSGTSCTLSLSGTIIPQAA